MILYRTCGDFSTSIKYIKKHQDIRVGDEERERNKKKTKIAKTRDEINCERRKICAKLFTYIQANEKVRSSRMFIRGDEVITTTCFVYLTKDKS